MELESARKVHRAPKSGGKAQKKKAKLEKKENKRKQDQQKNKKGGGDDEITPKERSRNPKVTRWRLRMIDRWIE